jgi:hypothetical protein
VTRPAVFPNTKPLNKYLVSYDYGTGGLWVYILASSPEAITERYPELKVWLSKPKWWGLPHEEGIRTYRLDTLDDEWAPAKLLRKPQS